MPTTIPCTVCSAPLPFRTGGRRREYCRTCAPLVRHARALTRHARARVEELDSAYRDRYQRRTTEALCLAWEGTTPSGPWRVCACCGGTVRPRARTCGPDCARVWTGIRRLARAADRLRSTEEGRAWLLDTLADAELEVRAGKAEAEGRTEGGRLRSLVRERA